MTPLTRCAYCGEVRRLDKIRFRPFCSVGCAIEYARAAYRQVTPGVDAMDYVIWSNEHLGWWRPFGQGYTRDPFQAGRYRRDEALAICQRALLGSPDGVPNEIMVLADDVCQMLEGNCRCD